ncbi:PEP/pyruvate-binding domain-containing protein [Patescibacteria group bacterium]
MDYSNLNNSENFGMKTLALKRLMEKGFNVPEFVAIGADEVLELFDESGKIKKNHLKKLSEGIVEQFECKRFAVRSSALIEDMEDSAMAGQFETVLNVSASKMEEAFEKVLNQAYEKLKGDMENFSMIVQDFIDADYAGVSFTRNPMGGREMIVEYSEGVGEKVVGGEVQPERMQFFWSQNLFLTDLPDFDLCVDIYKAIEGLFGAPQDIEWCIRDDALYILQTRPITSLGEEEYKGYLYLDDNLPQDDFFFEKTEIAEIAERPSNFTLSLLERIYWEDGPVKKVYQKYGVDYEMRDFLKVIGNELYVDREKELQTLLPSYSYFKDEELSVKFNGLNGIWRTMKNIWKLNRISLRNYVNLKEAIAKKLACKWDQKDFKKVMEDFLADYELIFEINLLTEKALKNLEKALGKSEISIAEILGAAFDDEEESLFIQGENLKGNCLEISDESNFITRHQPLKKNPKVNEWFEGLANWKQKFLRPIIIDAQQYSRLREYGRWLTVRNISYLREILKKKAENVRFGELRNVFFLTIDEIFNDIFSEELCFERRSEYEVGNDFSFSARLSSVFVEKERKLIGVSGGIAEGILVDLKGLEDHQGEDVILYTEVLAPDLVEVFDKVVGIVSENGGILSHLAIMARENGVPVIVGLNMKKEKINLGDFVKIDANKGKIQKKKT